MPDLPPLVQRVVADISGFQKGMAETRAEMDTTTSKSGGFVSNLKDQLGGVGLAVGGAALALGKFAFDSAEAFAKTTAEVRNFQRASGASAEDSSKLVAASKELGIGADTAASAMFKLSKNVATHSDTLKADGVQIAVNRQGNTDLVGTLLSVSDAYNRTQDPAQKTKIVFDAFGKSGAAMIPILQRGRDGLKDLFAEAEKHHQVFDNAELEKGKQFSLAMAGLHQTFEGLQTEVGSAVIPTFTDFAHALTTVTEKIDSINSIAGGKGGGFLGKFVETVAQDVDPALLLFGQHSDKAKQQVQDFTEAEQKSQLATGLYGQSQQDASQAALQHMVASGRLTQAQLDQNVAMHLAKDGSLDYAGTLKELDPTTAVLVDRQARLDAGLGDARSAFERAKDAAGDYQTQIDQLLSPLLNADQANVQWHQELDKLTQSLHDNGNTIDLNTKKGQDNAAQLVSTTQAGVNYIDKLIAEGAQTDVVNGKKAALIASLREEEQHYPALAPMIDNYIVQIQAIPATAATTVTANVDDAVARINALRADIAALRTESSQPISAGAFGGVGVSHGGAKFYAAGGIVDRPTLAWVGEQSHREVILPMDDPRRAMELARQSGLMAMLSGGSGGSASPLASVGGGAGAISVTVNLTVNAATSDPRGLAQGLARYIRDELRNYGTNNQNGEPVGLR